MIHTPEFCSQLNSDIYLSVINRISIYLRPKVYVLDYAFDYASYKLFIVQITSGEASS